MAECKVWESKVSLTLSLTLSEAEARALSALTEYGIDPFLKTFYEHMGTSCLKPHEAGLRLLFGTVAQMDPHLLRADKAREAFKASANQ